MSLLDGRVALVIGASRGIGAVTADVLAREGATVIRVARSLNESAPGRFHDIPCDLTQGDQVDRLAARGSFITVGSVADHIGFPENAAYAASSWRLGRRTGSSTGSAWARLESMSRRLLENISRSTR